MSIELEKLGYDVIGVDSSPNMLTVAASKKVKIATLCTCAKICVNLICSVVSI